MPPGNARRTSLRRGPRPRHTRQEVIEAAIAIADAEGFDAVTFRAVAARLRAGTMSLYSYVPDKQTLVHEMVQRASGELELPRESSGDWRADLHLLACRQRAVVHHHPWLIAALSHRQPFGPATLAYLEFGLAALEPTGLPAERCLEAIGLLTGFILNFVRTELANSGEASDPAWQAAENARLQELLATGRYPRFAAAVSQGGHPDADLAGSFTRLLDRMLDGLIRPNDTKAKT